MSFQIRPNSNLVLIPTLGCLVCAWNGGGTQQAASCSILQPYQRWRHPRIVRTVIGALAIVCATGIASMLEKCHE